ncbi:glycosyltransferase [Homoserinimonas sp. A447]
MRIGIIAPPWIPVPPPAYGGIEEVVDGLARGLHGLGHDVLLAAGAGSTCAVSRIAATERCAPRPIGDVESERHHVVLAYAACRHAGVDVVHDHTLCGPGYGGRPRGVPNVTTVHGPFTREMRRLYGSLPPDVAIVAISQHQASTAAGVRINRVIHHGIDVTAIRPGDGAGGYLAFLGRMTPAKGVREAILIARNSGVPLKIAAKMREPREWDYFSSVIAPMLGGDVEYLGELNRVEKYALLGSALALLNPIQWPEPFGMVMIEAMATGTPVIATPRGAAPEIIEDGRTGMLRERAADAVAAIHEVGSLNRSTVRRRVEQRFSLEIFARAHARFYEDLGASSLAGAAVGAPAAG